MELLVLDRLQKEEIMAFDWPTAISIGAPVLGGLFGAREAAGASRHASNTNAAIAAENIRLQKEFAQHGIKWKMQDAREAGVNPLYALGASTQSFSPVSVGATPDMSMADFYTRAGQDVSRAITATKSAEERTLDKLRLAGAKADVEGKIIDNEIRASQLQKISAVGPAMPDFSDNFIPGQGNSPKALVKEKPLERTVSAPGRPAQEAGWRPDVSYSRTDTGLTPMVPESLSESLEDDFVGKILWRLRNNIMPSLTGSGAPSKHMLPKGYVDWEYSPVLQEWKPVKWKARHPFKKMYHNMYGYE